MNTEVITQNVNILADTRELTENDWLTLRKQGVGGSEISALFGLNPWQSPLSIYLSKTADVQQEENKHLKHGKRMEPVIRGWLPGDFKEATGIDMEVCEFPYLVQSKEHEFLVADIDGLFELAQDYTFKAKNGEDWEEITIPANIPGILEIKTASEREWKKWKDDGIPDYYLLQLMHYMTVFKLDYALIAALVGKELVWRFVLRDDDFSQMIIARAKEFWLENVQKRIPPAPIGISADENALKYLYPQEVKDKALDLSHMADKRLRYKEIAEEIKALQAEQDKIKQEFMAAMGDAEIAFVGDKKVSWKMQAGSTYTVTRKPQRVLRIG